MSPAERDTQPEAPDEPAHTDGAAPGHEPQENERRTQVFGRVTLVQGVVFLGLNTLVHMAGYHAYDLVHGFGGAPTTWAGRSIQTFTLGGLVAYFFATRRLTTSLPWANWRVETLKTVVATEAALLLCCWGLLWVPAEVSSQTATLLMMSGWNAVLIGGFAAHILRSYFAKLREHTEALATNETTPDIRD